jgi:hypothetical protein
MNTELVKHRILTVVSTIVCFYTATNSGPSFAAPAPSTALTNRSSVKAEQLPKAPLDPSEDVDQIITNPRLRAGSGSKSKYSISTGFGYSGGSLKRPFGDTRPNISGATGTTDFAVFGASVSGKYSLTPQSAVFAGTGFRIMTPLGGLEKPKGFSGQKFDLDNPSIRYQYLYRWADKIQSALSVSQTFFTASNLRANGFLTSWGISQDNVMEIGHSGVSLALSGFVGFGVFDKSGPEQLKEQSDYGFGLSPAIEYRINDRFNLRFDTNLFNFQHIRSTTAGWTFRRLDTVQNFNVGIALARDVFISPGVSFVLGDLRADRTTFGIGGSINLF